MAALEERQLAWRAIILLAGALDLLADLKRWTRKGYAIDGRGRQVRVDDPRARRFCAVGAVLLSEHRLTGEPVAVATDPAPEVDDLSLPVVPDAAPHVGFALDALGYGALAELRANGVTVKQTAEASLSLRHMPMVLGLTRRTGHREAVNVIVRAIRMVSATALRADQQEQMSRGAGLQPPG
jgi:hypothetical protein